MKELGIDEVEMSKHTYDTSLELIYCLAMMRRRYSQRIKEE